MTVGSESRSAERVEPSLAEETLGAEGRQPSTAREETGFRWLVRGTVQGVGFRPWVHRMATALELRGRVYNDRGGVVVEVFGPPKGLDDFAQRLSQGPGGGARVAECSGEKVPLASGEAWPCFIIDPSQAHSRRDAVGQLMIPPDTAPCSDCLDELNEPRDRRFGYPFLTCTQCGPRFTVARGLPFDRETTAMEAFPLCPDCENEYQDPANRRFHAQVTACPRCGPRLQLRPADGGAAEVLASDDAVGEVVRRLRCGDTVAIKGLGGFHLACDATSSTAVERLRRRKQRSRKPFAVMVRDLDMARQCACLSHEEEALLATPERPIVLVRSWPGSPLANSVAPELDQVGLFLPYTPLHSLLLDRCGRPLVLTSGNLSEEPIARTNREALDRLRHLADAFLLHDREIMSRCDDSVARVIEGTPVVLRRSRGYVPREIRLPLAASRPVLASGGQLKATVCLVHEDRATLSPHIGDLSSPETFRAYEETIDHLKRLLGFVPEVVAYDQHPDYLSTRYAERALGDGAVEVGIAVQHHHAHLASVLAEHCRIGPALGVIFDGTGYGADGTLWGGEILCGDASDFRRLATLRPLRLWGGEQAIREVWRLALTAVDDAFEGESPVESLALFAAVGKAKVEQLRELMASSFPAPSAHGAGRYFDAVGALVLGQTAASYEGEVAQRLGDVAERSVLEGYPFDLKPADIEGSPLDSSAQEAVAEELSLCPWQIDLRPAIRAVVEDLLSGHDRAKIAGRFHHTLAEAVATVVRQSIHWGVPETLPVALSGGCFANPLLVEAISSRLSGKRQLLQHRQVPPGDGGLALGQAFTAVARLQRQEGSSCV